MQIVIDIPNIAYENTKRFGKLSTINDDELANAIINGTVLPKNHGKLIDADKLGLTNFEIVMCDGDYKEALKMLCEKIKNAPTIVDAEVKND